MASAVARVKAPVALVPATEMRVRLLSMSATAPVVAMSTMVPVPEVSPSMVRESMVSSAPETKATLRVSVPPETKSVTRRLSPVASLWARSMVVADWGVAADMSTSPWMRVAPVTARVAPADMLRTSVVPLKRRVAALRWRVPPSTSAEVKVLPVGWSPVRVHWPAPVLSKLPKLFQLESSARLKELPVAPSPASAASSTVAVPALLELTLSPVAMAAPVFKITRWLVPSSR